MQDIEKIFAEMKEEIQEESSEEVKAILDEVKKTEEDAMNSMKAEAKKNADLRMKQELEEMHSDAAAEISEVNSERMKKLIKKRDEYVQIIFDEVKDELIKFTSSPDYKDYMEKKAKEAAKADLATATMYVRDADLDMADALRKAYGKEIDVKSTERIELGGLIVEDEASALVLDETLDLAYRSQQEWFNKNSGLVIK